MIQDANSEQRSEIVTKFLQGLENYIDEIAKTYPGLKPDEIAVLFKENFQRQMLANADYHRQMADANKQNGETAMSEFHKMHADIYNSMSCKDDISSRQRVSSVDQLFSKLGVCICARIYAFKKVSKLLTMASMIMA